MEDGFIFKRFTLKQLTAARSLLQNFPERMSGSPLTSTSWDTMAAKVIKFVSFFSTVFNYVSDAYPYHESPSFMRFDMFDISEFSLHCFAVIPLMMLFWLEYFIFCIIFHDGFCVKYPPLPDLICLISPSFPYNVVPWSLWCFSDLSSLFYCIIFHNGFCV